MVPSVIGYYVIRHPVRLHFSGALCDELPCDRAPCSFGGTCINDPEAKDGFTCRCPPGLTGEYQRYPSSSRNKAVKISNTDERKLMLNSYDLFTLSETRTRTMGRKGAII